MVLLSFWQTRMVVQRAVLAAACGWLVAFGSAKTLAEPAGKILLPPGFRAELVYSVPLETQGSWVSLAVDEKGRLIASDQNGSLYRITPSAIGGPTSNTLVEAIQVPLGMAHGLLCHNGALYVTLNGQIGSFTSGLYRVTDSDKDDKYDRVELLRVLDGEGEHGPHAILPSPDGKSLYLCAGNFTRLPGFVRSYPAPVWAEDQLLPRMTDPNGHAVDIKAPGGWVARTDLDGNNLEVVSVGYRNMFDVAFNDDGELFTFDSDMEWDIGMPWYRPTRLDHVVPGSDYGWRTGNGMWPDYYIDTLPGSVNAGPGSPTGLTFGRGTKFPEKYQKALFAGDWSYGNIYMFHTQPHGASYTGTVERFASAMPLGVTDIVVRPQDGALYFAVGGRKSESGLYRIVWTGDAAADGVKAAEAQPQAVASEALPATPPEEAAKARELRHSLERLMVGPAQGAVDKLWPQLSNQDRFIRYAARAALEHQPVQSWRKRALEEPNVDAKLAALCALARTGKKRDQKDFMREVCQFNFDQLNRTQRLEQLRVAALGYMRLGPLQPGPRQELLAEFDKRFPTGDREIDRELSHLLIVLGAQNMVDRLLAILDKAVTQEEGIDAAVALSSIRSGWTVEQRTKLLDWFDKAAKTGGGNSYFGYLIAARDRFISTFTDADRKALGSRIEKPLVAATPQIETASRPVVRQWTVDELTPAVESHATGRSFENGRKLFSAAGCYNCHRVSGEGSSVGPDLTGVGGRFGVKDLLRAIVEPNKEISDQYRQMIFSVDGLTIVGRVTNIDHESLMVSTNMLNPKDVVRIPRQDIEVQKPADISIMPSGLLNTLTEDEVCDLAAFLRSGGRKDSPLYSTAQGGQ